MPATPQTVWARVAEAADAARRRNEIRRTTMYNFTLSPPDRPAPGRQACSASSRTAKLLAGGQTLIPTMKQRLASPTTSSISARSQELPGIELKRPLDRDRRDDPACRRRELAGREGGHPGARRARRPDRRSGGAPPRHDRRLGRQQRSGRRLSGGAASALGATIITNKRKIAADDFFTGLFETALEAGEIITKVELPDRRRRPATRSSATRPRAMRWSACSSPSAARTSASR